MARQVQWLGDEEPARIEPLAPQGCKGARRMDDRRVSSCIVHMLKSGGLVWLPAGILAYMTAYNRFNRWSGRGLEMFETLTGRAGICGAVIDATDVKAHGSPPACGRVPRGP
ncbi:hypothetical protein AS593_18225 [Caulobacter vibrioides]|nr:hypothetical protein AS593_18225 [Caulobacter vibrioides]